MILTEMLINWLCLAEKHCLSYLKRLILSSWTRIRIHRALSWQSIKKRNICRRSTKGMKDIASDLIWVLVLCGWYLSLMKIIQWLVPPVLRSTETVACTDEAVSDVFRYQSLWPSSPFPQDIMLVTSRIIYCRISKKIKSSYSNDRINTTLYSTVFGHSDSITICHTDDRENVSPSFKNI